MYNPTLYFHPDKGGQRKRAYQGAALILQAKKWLPSIMLHVHVNCHG